MHYLIMLVIKIQPFKTGEFNFIIGMKIVYFLILKLTDYNTGNGK